MNSREIKAQLILNGIFFADIADEAQCSVSQVSRCINGTGIYLRVREVIARKLGKKVHEIFQSNHPSSKRERNRKSAQKARRSTAV